MTAEDNAPDDSLSSRSEAPVPNWIWDTIKSFRRFAFFPWLALAYAFFAMAQAAKPEDPVLHHGMVGLTLVSGAMAVLFQFFSGWNDWGK